MCTIFALESNPLSKRIYIYTYIYLFIAFAIVFLLNHDAMCTERREEKAGGQQINLTNFQSIDIAVAVCKCQHWLLLCHFHTVRSCAKRVAMRCHFVYRLCQTNKWTKRSRRCVWFFFLLFSLSLLNISSGAEK